MNRTKKLTVMNWSVTVGLFLIFLIWHGAFEGPLSSAEIERYLERYQQHYPEEDATSIRRFLEEDDGKPIGMVNAIKLYDTPIEVNGQSFGNTTEEALREYTSFVLPYLLKRGSYPTYSGDAVYDAVEVWGIENAEAWSSGALMRYRSRRVMMEMVTDPNFVHFHDAKIAAIEKTIVFPTTADVSTGNLAVTVGLGLLSLALGMQLLINGKNEKTSELLVNSFSGSE